MKVKFNNWDCDVQKHEYPHNGQIALVLVDAETQERIAVASVSINSPVPDDHCWIKDWLENEGIAKVLEQAGIIQLTGRTEKTGYVEAKEAKVLI